MTPQERFKKICSFELPNEVFIWSVDSWNDAFDRWVDEGMPVTNLDNKKQVNEHLLGMQDQNEGIIPKGAIGGMGKNNNPPWCVAIDPVFEVEIIEETDEWIIERDYDGSVNRRQKGHDDAIPQYFDYPVKDRKTWEEYKKRLDPHSPGRWPAGWEIMTGDKLTFPIKPEHEGKHFKHRDFPLGMNLLSLYGNIRNYMGLENISFAIFEQPTLIDEMLDWQMHIALEMLKKVLDAGVTLEWVWLWEDMAYNTGPLVSPKWVKEHMVPRYKPVVEMLRNAGVDALILDCDGNLDELMPIWVDCGINATYPIEIAAGNNPIAMRKKFGDDLILIGGIDKRELAKGKVEIDRQVDVVRELLPHSGYFPNCDHHIPPNVPYENVKYWINEMRKLSASPELRRVIP